PRLNDPTVAQPIATPPTTTKYFVTVTDSVGCQSTDNVLVTVAPQLHPRLTADRDTVYCASDFATLMVPDATIKSWQWNTNEKTKSIKATPGAHWCVVSDGNCSGISDTIMVAMA